MPNIICRSRVLAPRFSHSLRFFFWVGCAIIAAAKFKILPLSHSSHSETKRQQMHHVRLPLPIAMQNAFEQKEIIKAMLSAHE